MEFNPCSFCRHVTQISQIFILLFLSASILHSYSFLNLRHLRHLRYLRDKTL